MEALLRHGANVNGKNKDGETPLHRAAWGPQYNDKVTKDVRLEDYIKTIKYLIERGANKKAHDNEGIKPQQIAVQMKEKYSKYLHNVIKVECILEP